VLEPSLLTSFQSISKTTDSIQSLSEIFVVHSNLPSGETFVLLIVILEKVKGASSFLSTDFNVKDNGLDFFPSGSSAVIVQSNSSVASTKGAVKVISQSLSTLYFTSSSLKLTLYFN
jgi:hypothetical protein